MSFDDFRKELVEAGELDSEEAEKLDLMELIRIYQKFKIRQATGGASKPSSLRAELMRTSVRKKTPKPRTAKAPKKRTEAPRKRSKPSRPHEGLVYALGKLTTIAKGGNYCMTVVDGCWVNFRYKKRGNHLYFQVSGDKYIPKRSHFEKKHIEILKKMGIMAEPMSDDIFSTHFNDKPRNLERVVDTVFEIFHKVYRVRKGADAYIEFVIGSKPSAEMADAVEGMYDYFNDRDGKSKFRWEWNG
jgi:hypothetical protein